MIHFFKSSKIHLDCFTSRQEVINYAPIVPATKVIPKWWKALPKGHIAPNNFFKHPNMKGCSGLIDYYKNSVAMPLWSELAINVSEDTSYNWQFSDFVSVGDPHNKEQYDGFINGKKYGHLKLVSPWLFSTKQATNWVLSQPIYNEPNFFDYTTVTGVLNFYHQATTNLQLFINLEHPKTINIAFNTPFLFTPLSDKEVVIHRHLIGKEEYASREKNGRITFLNMYKNRKAIEKCPFTNHVETK